MIFLSSLSVLRSSDRIPALLQVQQVLLEVTAFIPHPRHTDPPKHIKIFIGEFKREPGRRLECYIFTLIEHNSFDSNQPITLQ